MPRSGPISTDGSLKAQWRSLPQRPGVYLFKDPSGEILYVGKAQNLKGRVASYLRPAHRLAPKTQRLMEKAHSLDWIATDTAHEALILEADLVRQEQPHYNVLLRDDKRFPWLRLSVRDPYPILRVVRHRVKDGALYFGPYTSVAAMRQVLQLVRIYYPLRKCRYLLEPGVRISRHKGPCLYKQLGQCLAPCEGDLDPAVYARVVEEVKEVLTGRICGLADKARDEMKRLAHDRLYEDAARYLDKMNDLLLVAEKAGILTRSDEDEDILAAASLGDDGVVVTLLLREGRLAGRQDMPLSGMQGAPMEEALEAYLLQRYAEGTPIPAKISVPVSLKSMEDIQRVLTQRAGHLVTLLSPRSGERRRLLAMAERNANLLLLREPVDGTGRVLPPQNAWHERLGLAAEVHVVDAVDAANFGDAILVGSAVRFEDGQPQKGDYRKFTMKQMPGRDDVASIRQIVARHVQQILRRQGRLPDLLLVDGGEGHRHAAEEVVARLQQAIPVVGLAKEDEILHGPLKGQTLKLDPTDMDCRLLIRARDEAHRFAQAHLHRLSSKGVKESILDRIPAIGRARKEALLRAFGSIEAIRSASMESLQQVEGIGPALAEQIKGHLMKG